MILWIVNGMTIEMAKLGPLVGIEGEMKRERVGERERIIGHINA